MKKTEYIVLIILSFLCRGLTSQTSFCVNADFELSATGTYTSSTGVSGWTVSSQSANCSTTQSWTPGSSEFSITATPFTVANLGYLSTSPLGGTNIAVINNTVANTSRTKLAQSLTVPTGISYFQFAYAGVWQGGNHLCCEQAHFKVQIKDCMGNLLACPSFSLGAGNCPNALTYSVQNGVIISNWTTQLLNLSPYAGNCITIEIICSDCAYGDHYGTLFFDAACLSPGNIGPPVPTTALFCPGGTATLAAPLSFMSYLWMAPPNYTIAAAQSTVAAITVTNPIAGDVFTVNITVNPFDCPYQSLITLQQTTTSIIGLGASPSCSNGASGSGTINTTMPWLPYTYTWVSATNSVSTTNTLVNNLAPGVYTVSANAANSGSCGIATSTVAVSTRPAYIQTLTPYCNNTAYLNTPSGSSNIQWYNGTAAISSTLGGTAPSYTASGISTNSIYSVVYHSAQGCNDSLRFNLFAALPGSISVNYSNIACTGNTVGLTIVTMTPSLISQGNLHYYNIVSSGSFTPTYSASSGPITSNTFTANGLVAGGIYSLQASDGVCPYQTTFTINTASVFDYTISPHSFTICPNTSTLVQLQFNTPPALFQYNYSWSPATFLSGTSQTIAIVSPTAASGSSLSTVIYTIVVTPSVAYCPVIKTFSMTILPAVTPTIASVPVLCSNSPAYTISANPAGGAFFNSSPGLSSTGVLTPNSAFTGIHTFTYGNGPCIGTASASFTLIPPYITPTLTPVPVLCINSPLYTVSVNPPGGSFHITGVNGMNPLGIILPPAAPLGTSSFTYVGANCVANAVSSFTIIPPYITPTIVPLPTLCVNSPAQTIQVSPPGGFFFESTTPPAITNGILTPSLTSPGTHTFTYGSSACAAITTGSYTIIGPTLSITGNMQVCPGQSLILTASGADTYSWDTGVTTSTALYTPMGNEVHQVTGITNANGCAGTATVGLTTFPVTSVSIIGTSVSCAGGAIVLYALGISNYTWSNTSTLNSITVSPTTNTVYTVYTHDANNCLASGSWSVHVIPLPPLAITGTTLICLGEGAHIDLMGADSYWLNGVHSPTTNQLLTPSVTTIYSLYGSSNSGCNNSITFTIQVDPCTGLPDLSENPEIQIYPTLTNGEFVIETAFPRRAELYNELGNLVLSRELMIKTNRIDISTLNRGIYFIKIRTAQGTQVKKIIKN